MRAASSDGPDSPSDERISASRAQASASFGSSVTACSRLARAPSRSNCACCAYDSAISAADDLGSAATAFFAVSSAASARFVATLTIADSARAEASFGFALSAASRSFAASSTLPVASLAAARWLALSGAPAFAYRTGG